MIGTRFFPLILGVHGFAVGGMLAKISGSRYYYQDILQWKTKDHDFFQCTWLIFTIKGEREKEKK
jgi:hypothetical protein